MPQLIDKYLFCLGSPHSLQTRSPFVVFCRNLSFEHVEADSDEECDAFTIPSKADLESTGRGKESRNER